MATITIRNIDDSIKKRLRVQAASHNRSMEEEARRLLKSALSEDKEIGGMGTLIHKRFIEEGGIDLPEPKRNQTPRIPESLK
ncbi:MAG: FitA-like ribbon-helix-helix domain-containing protein [Spirochaetaceae bacterium]